MKTKREFNKTEFPVVVLLLENSETKEQISVVALLSDNRLSQEYKKNVEKLIPYHYSIQMDDDNMDYATVKNQVSVNHGADLFLASEALKDFFDKSKEETLDIPHPNHLNILSYLFIDERLTMEQLIWQEYFQKEITETIEQMIKDLLD